MIDDQSPSAAKSKTDSKKGNPNTVIPVTSEIIFKAEADQDSTNRLSFKGITLYNVIVCGHISQYNESETNVRMRIIDFGSINAVAYNKEVLADLEYNG